MQVPKNSSRTLMVTAVNLSLNIDDIETQACGTIPGLTRGEDLTFEGRACQIKGPTRKTLPTRVI